MAFNPRYASTADPRALRATKSMAVFGGSMKQPGAGLRDAAYVSPFMTFRPIPGVPEPPFQYFPPTGSGSVALKGENGYLDRQRPAPPPFHHARPKAPLELLGRLPRPRPVDLLRDDMEKKMDDAFLSMPEDCQECVRMQVTQELWLKKMMDDEDAIIDTKMKYLVAMLEWLGNLQNGAHFLGFAQRVMDATLRFILANRGL
ncbi:hypothetical protein DACRYDRAFT_22402 [Dacryopinax primogenitus]|uniref:Uncharacterized protein n=1 Tax=Dacryopinax primogenitus (strain DJM 731) TaxID=1858805 RepID=M5G1D0_DACPD|nr:uncharacterized protein DACRYDRAFT_22402 [Dacryopinax primogenitus]EJU02000.1 hypothetical protein DACRYDRAFT_22402 [Dacryopinax primogenitus]